MKKRLNDYEIIQPFSKMPLKKAKINLMCRNIKQLHNFAPPATDEEIEAAALQFVRKLSGFNKPSAANAEAFQTAIGEITRTSKKLLESLVTNAPPKDRETEREKARERNRRRFGSA